MRMWKVSPQEMCDKHLLGEHVEMHMFVGTLRKGISIQGYLNRGLVDPQHIKSRHDELAKEMGRRGMVHRSPLEEIPSQAKVDELLRVDVPANRLELARRCIACRTRQKIHESF